MRTDNGLLQGIFVTYTLLEDQLLLQALTLREKNSNYIPVNGVSPAVTNNRATYHNLAMPVPFSGTLRLVAGIAEGFKPPVTMNFPTLAGFRTVYDIYIHKGIVTHTMDRSEGIEWARNAYRPDNPPKDIIDTIEEQFRLDPSPELE